jgi:peptide deformylase
MSDFLTINTEDDVVKRSVIEPLPLYDDNFAMLREVMPEYTDVLPNPIINKLVSRLKMTMKKFGGIGLSANQCGVYERVFVMGLEDNVFVCINPKIVEQSEELDKEKEGCLSFPGLSLSVQRPKWIVAEFVDETGVTHRMRFEGITARCYMHELDHMNGVRFVDHVGPVALRLAKQKQEKTVKKFQRQFKNKKNVFVPGN